MLLTKSQLKSRNNHKSSQLDASTSSGRATAGSQPGALKTCVQSFLAVDSRGLRGPLFLMQMLNSTAEHFHQRISNLLISKNRDKIYNLSTWQEITDG